MSQAFQYDDEYNNVVKFGDTVQINGPHDTMVVYNNSEQNIEYFDVRPLIYTLDRYNNNNFEVNRVNEVFILTGYVEGSEFKISINTKTYTLDIVNKEYNITHDFEKYEIRPTKYPIFQYTNNPMIVLLALLLSACRVSEIYVFVLMDACYNLASKLNDIDKNDYYVCENTALLLSIYFQQPWYLQKDAVETIKKKIMNERLREETLMTQKMTDCVPFNTNMGLLYANIDTELKDVKNVRNTYIKLESLIKSLKPDDEILEILLGNKSYFLVRRNNEIMTLNRDEYKTIKLDRIDKNIHIIYERLIDDYAKCLSYYYSMAGEIAPNGMSYIQ